MGMNDEVFEYFFEPEELEPFLSELRSSTAHRCRLTDTVQKKKPASVPNPSLTHAPPIASSSQVPATVVSRRDSNVESDFEDVATETASTIQPSTLVSEPQVRDDNRTRIRRFLSVHALGQYLYCPRSAILATERGDVDSDEKDVDEPPPRLTYLPNFDRERIEEVLKKKLGEIGFSAALGFSSVCLMVVGVLEQNRLLFFLPLFAFIASIMWMLRLAIVVIRLATRRRAAIVADARQPDPEVLGIQEVNWWSMLKSGFESVNHERPFRHPEFPLEGCPWRVLERDSMRIPVIRAGTNRLGNEKGKLYPKHQIRLVAYALLLEAAGHVNVPYGLVFPSDSPRGLAFPVTDQLRKETIEQLREFSGKLADSQEHQVEPRLPSPHRCRHCLHGRPEPIQIGEINRQRKLGNPVVVLMNGRGKTFHCDCGDRFGTAPPHEKSLELGLVASLQ